MLRPKHRANHLDAVVPGQRLQRGLPRIGLVDPRRPIAGPVGGEQQHPDVAKILREKAEELLRYLVDPMEVLEHQDQRTPLTALYRELPEGFESLAFDRFGIRQRRRAGDLLDFQQMEQDQPILVRIHPDLAKTRVGPSRRRCRGYRLRESHNCCAKDRAPANRGSRCHRRGIVLRPRSPVRRRSAGGTRRAAETCRCRARRRGRRLGRARFRPAEENCSGSRARSRDRQKPPYAATGTSRSPERRCDTPSKR